MPEPFITIIGLEVHVQLLTHSKLFCGCSTKFGAPPNTQTCPVCIGMPGTLPVMNREAFELALKTAVALNCTIAPFTKWDRKNYYYPDLPKGYQISQYDLPFSHDGYLEISDPKGRFATKRVGIIRAHLEEDAGKSMHDEAAGKADSRIDLNRTGTPLLEIVSQPDMRSALEAKAYLTELKLLLMYLGVSDCNMQEGSLRVDANVNLHIPQPDGRLAKTPIVEIKNMNSFRAVERALTYEAQRQYEVWQEDHVEMGQRPKQTRGWDDEANLTRAQRHKEESSDYRYFPEPDLVPVTVTAEKVAQVRSSLGESPAQLRQRLEKTYGITPYDSDVIVNQGRPLVDYFVKLAELTNDGKTAANWVAQDVLRVLNEQESSVEKFPVRAEALADLIKRVQAGDFNTSRAREVFTAMLAGKSLGDAVAALGIAKVDESELTTLAGEILAANPKIVADIKAGKVQAAASLIGQAKKHNANINPAASARFVWSWWEKCDWRGAASMSAIITLTTDFGSASPYAAAMKGVILGINPAAAHRGHFARGRAARCAARRGAVGRGHHLVSARRHPCGRDRSGRRHLAAVGLRPHRRSAISGPRQRLAQFVGHAQSADANHRTIERRLLDADGFAYLSRTRHLGARGGSVELGRGTGALGVSRPELVMLDWLEARRTANRIEGAVRWVDRFGNLITNVPASMLPPEEQIAQVRVWAADNVVNALSHAYGERKPQELTALVGSSGYLEIAVVDGSAAKALKIGVAAPVIVEW